MWIFVTARILKLACGHFDYLDHFVVEFDYPAKNQTVATGIGHVVV
jgi:hypothetical protein